MTETITPRLPFRRCPGCGAIDWPPHPVTHRHGQPCPYEGTDPATWEATDGSR